MKIEKTLLLVILFITISCGGDRSPASAPSISVGETLGTDITSLSTIETPIAERICRSFRSKRSNFHMNSIIGKTFTHNISGSHCSNGKVIDVLSSTLESTLKSPVASEGMIFDSLYEESYFNNVQTNINGELNLICPSVLRGDTPLTATGTTSDMKFISFEVRSEKDFFIIKKAKLETSDSGQKSYKVYETHSYEIDTTSTDNNLGVVKNIDLIGLCDDVEYKYSQELKEFK